MRACQDVDALVNTTRASFLRIEEPVAAHGFAATKLEAFGSPGSGDFLSKHDLEDVLNIVDGGADLADEMAAPPTELRQSVAKVFADPLKNPYFRNVLPGLIP